MAELGDIKSLSDAKLRSELQRLGFPAGPVTDSTRSILQKKLQKLRSEQKKPSKRASVGLPSRKVLGFSSDESENDTGPATGRQANTRRRSARGRLTTANRRSARATALEADNDSNDEENVDNNLPNARAFSFLNRDKSPKSQPNNVYNYNYTTEARPNVRPNLNRSGVGLGQGRFPNHTPNDRARDKSTLSADNDADDHLFTKPRPERNSSFFSRSRLFGSQTNDNEFSDSDVDHEPVSGRSNRTDVTMSKGDNNSYDAKANASYSAKRNSNSPLRNSGGNKTFNVTPDGEENAAEEAHRLRRRSSFNSTPKTSTPRKTTPHSLNRSEAGSFFGSSSDKKRLDGSLNRSASANEVSSRRYGRQNSNSLLEQEFATEENLSSSLGSKYSHIISMVLLACAFIFFAVLGVLYISVGSEEVPNVIKDENLLLTCERGDVCDTGKEEIKKFVQALHQVLSERAGLYQCGYLGEGEDQKMSKPDVIKYLEKEFEQQSKSPFWVEDMLTEVLQKIVTKDFDLGIQLLQNDKKQMTEEDDIELCYYLMSEHAAMPWLCRVRRSASLVLFRLAIIMLLVILSWLFVVYLRYYWRKQEEEREEVHHMVEKILDMLAKHHRACQNDSSKKTNNAYQAIPHVRDSIIPPAERQRMQRIWNKAVQFINTHESRVRVETQRIEGEEFQVWRWVQATLTPHHTSFAPVMELEYNPNRVKVWQGTGKVEGISPSVRQLFSPSSTRSTSSREATNLDNNMTKLYSDFQTACALEYQAVNQSPPECDLYGEVPYVETPTPISTLAAIASTTEEFLASLPTYSSETVAKLEWLTRGQARNSVWFEQRKGRITGSVAHAVMTRSRRLMANEEVDNTALLKRLLGYIHLNPNLPALKYGREMEDEAKWAYVQIMIAKGHNLDVRDCGLFVQPDQVYLGASPDGLVNCKCCKRGVLEIKCPYGIRHTSPSSDNVKYIEKTDKSCTLQKSHQYYTQVQLQMGVTGTKWCDFFVYSRHGSLRIRMSFDEERWTEIRVASRFFFMNYMAKELVKQTLPANSVPETTYEDFLS